MTDIYRAEREKLPLATLESYDKEDIIFYFDDVLHYLDASDSMDTAMIISHLNNSALSKNTKKLILGVLSELRSKDMQAIEITRVKKIRRTIGKTVALTAGLVGLALAANYKAEKHFENAAWGNETMREVHDNNPIIANISYEQWFQNHSRIDRSFPDKHWSADNKAAQAMFLTYLEMADLDEANSLTDRDTSRFIKGLFLSQSGPWDLPGCELKTELEGQKLIFTFPNPTSHLSETQSVEIFSDQVQKTSEQSSK